MSSSISLQPSPSNEQPGGAFGYWSQVFSSFEVAMLASILFVVAAVISTDVYFKHRTAQVLVGPGLGAERMARHRDVYGARVAYQLALEIEKTRAPGLYLAGLAAWTDVLESAGSPDDVAWVTAIKSQERADAKALLAKVGVPREALEALRIKLNKVSPQLTDTEEGSLRRLTSTDALFSVGELKQKTGRGLRAKLEDLGATTWGLESRGIRLPELE